MATPRQRLRESLQKNADQVEKWPLEVREAISTRGIFNVPQRLTLKEVLGGAERAAKRVAQWPRWKRDLSGL